MSKDLPQTHKSDEVDLGQLFKLIGNAFDKLFRFIGYILSKLYDILLFFLIHVFKRIKWYVGATIIGLIIGYFIDKKSEFLYSASIKIETNYGSSRQVYENVSFLNHLAEFEKDSVELAKRLKISVSEAASIRGFTIEPNIDENDKMKLFSDFRAQLDSLTRDSFTYHDYVDGLSSYSFSTHLVEVKATNKFIFPKLNLKIAQELADNSYLNELRDVTLANLQRKEQIIDTQKKTLDSLKTTYLSIRELESQKKTFEPGTGTNLFLGDAQQQNLIVDETKLVERRLELDNEKLDVYKGIIENKNVVNVISEFPAAGYDVNEWFDKNLMRMPVLLILITLLIFIILGLKKYLEKEEKRLLTQ